jgi:hypothetical protein
MRRGRLTAAVLMTLGLGLGAAAPSAALAAQPTASQAPAGDSAAAAEGDDMPVASAAAKPKPKEGDVDGHRRLLLVTYATTKDCVVHANYPIPAGHDHTFTIAKGAEIVWRYNVTKNIAAVARPGTKDFPHWGFTDRSCIGKTVGKDGKPYQVGTYRVYHKGHWVVHHTPRVPAGQAVPSRLLSGRSQYDHERAGSYWTSVHWCAGMGAVTNATCPDHGTVPAAERRMAHDRTLRDAPHAFVTGNVYQGWAVRTTGIEKSGYWKVYVPELKRWGWVQY